MSDRRSHSDMAHELAKLVYGKVTWLHRFASGKDKRPDHDVERVRRERDVLLQAKDDYENAAHRDTRAA